LTQGFGVANDLYGCSWILGTGSICVYNCNWTCRLYAGVGMNPASCLLHRMGIGFFGWPA